MHLRKSSRLSEPAPRPRTDPIERNADMTEFLHQLLGLPQLASEHGEGVDNLIVYIHLLMIALFVGWLCLFPLCAVAVPPARNPKADYVGVRNHASSYLEVAVAGIEAALAAVRRHPALGQGGEAVSQGQRIHRDPGRGAAVRLERPLRRARTASWASRT